MDFLGFGSGEIFLIIIVALLLWGPGRMVDIARKLGKIVNNLRKATSDLTNQITQELDEEKRDGAIKPDGKKP